MDFRIPLKKMVVKLKKFTHIDSKDFDGLQGGLYHERFNPHTLMFERLTPGDVSFLLEYFREKSPEAEMKIFDMLEQGEPVY